MSARSKDGRVGDGGLGIGGVRWQLAGHWYLRLCTMGIPFPLLALMLAFTFSRRCTHSTCMQFSP